mmetsp:Transcript_59170/g.135376  ORF Transcript_59170/g.135376 Transcript_59170/m.135376 type:complete len:248 (-) Transcript_59170:954-1697(-)
MTIASVIASSPDFDFARVSMLMSCSSPRNVVEVLRSFQRPAMESVSSWISDSSSSFLSSRLATSTFRVLTSWYLKSRSFSALPSSSLQNPSFVASPMDSLSNLSMSPWIKSLTLAKGSPANFMASMEIGWLLRRMPSLASSSTVESRCAWLSSVALAALATAWWLWARTAALCTNEGGTTAAFAAGLLAAWPLWTRALMLTASSMPWTRPAMMARASVMAESSSARICERWSQSWALASHRSVRSFK